MDTSQTFVIEATQAASIALAAVAAGQALEADNLIAGAMALELVANRQELAGFRFSGLPVAIRGLRTLANGRALAASQGGQLAADSFAAMLIGVLAQWAIIEARSA